MPDSLKKVTGLRNSHARVLALNEVLKFKPVVVIAVLICDPLVSV